MDATHPIPRGIGGDISDLSDTAILNDTGGLLPWEFLKFAEEALPPDLYMWVPANCKRSKKQLQQSKSRA